MEMIHFRNWLTNDAPRIAARAFRDALIAVGISTVDAEDAARDFGADFRTSMTSFASDLASLNCNLSGREVDDLIAGREKTLREIVTDTVKTAFRKLNLRPSAATRSSTMSISMRENLLDDPAGGYASGARGLGEFALDVIRASVPGGQLSSKLAAYKSRTNTPQLAGQDSYGGFLVPTALADPIIPILEQNPIRAAAMKFTLNPGEGDSMLVPKVTDHDHSSFTTFGGIRSYWVAEATQKTETRAKTESVRLSLKCCCAFSTLTQQLINFGRGQMVNFFAGLSTQNLAWTEYDAHLTGTGGGMPLGVLTSGAKITHNRQTAGLVTASDVINLYARMWGPGRNRAIWIINADCIPNILTMHIEVGTAAGAIMLANFRDNVPAAMLGRPIYYSEHASALGTEADVIFVDPQQYAVLDFSGNPDIQMSVHLRFDYNESALRVEIFTDGASLWDVPLTPHRGTKTVSPIVVLGDKV